MIDLYYGVLPKRLALMLDHELEGNIVVVANEDLTPVAAKKFGRIAIARYLAVEHWVKKGRFRILVDREGKTEIKLINPFKSHPERVWELNEGGINYRILD